MAKQDDADWTISVEWRKREKVVRLMFMDGGQILNVQEVPIQLARSLSTGLNAILSGRRRKYEAVNFIKGMRNDIHIAQPGMGYPRDPGS